MSFGLDPSTVALGLGGLLGALARAIWTRGQKSLGVATLPDVVIGAALGVLLPVAGSLISLAGVPLPLPPMDGWTPMHKGALMFIVAAATVDLVKERVLHQFDARDRRADDHAPVPEPPK